MDKQVNRLLQRFPRDLLKHLTDSSVELDDLQKQQAFEFITSLLELQKICATKQDFETEALVEQIHQLNDEVARRQKEIPPLEAQHKTQQSVVESVQKIISSQEAILSSLRATKQANLEALNLVTIKITSERQNVDDASNRFAQERQEREESFVTMEREMHAYLESLSAEKARLREEIVKRKNEVERRREYLVKLSANNNIQQRQVQEQNRRELENLERLVKEQREILNGHLAGIAAQEKKNEELHQQICILEHQSRQLKANHELLLYHRMKKLNENEQYDQIKSRNETLIRAKLDQLQRDFKREFTSLEDQIQRVNLSIHNTHAELQRRTRLKDELVEEVRCIQAQINERKSKTYTALDEIELRELQDLLLKKKAAGPLRPRTRQK